MIDTINCKIFCQTIALVIIGIIDANHIYYFMQKIKDILEKLWAAKWRYHWADGIKDSDNY